VFGINKSVLCIFGFGKLALREVTVFGQNRSGSVTSPAFKKWRQNMQWKKKKQICKGDLSWIWQMVKCVCGSGKNKCKGDYPYIWQLASKDGREVNMFGNMCKDDLP
jgi:hypothetical protein